DDTLKNIRLIDSSSSDTAGAKTSSLDKQFTVVGSAKATILDLKVTGFGTAGMSTAFDNMLTGIETALKSTATGAAERGAAKARIDMQKDFIPKLSDSIDRGVRQLDDADMNNEST